jgi:ATP/ADP translocase
MNEVRPLNEEKPWWQSKGVVGPVIAIIATILSFFNIVVSAENQAQLVEALLTTVAVIGSVIGIIGRVLAEKKLK